MTRRFPTGSPYDREILRLAFPALGALLAQPLYVLSDTAVVGHLGTDELAGLAVASTLLLTGFAMFIFLAYGTTAAVARLLGAGDQGQAAHQAVQGMWLGIAIGVGVAGAGLAIAEPLVGVMGATGAVRVNALVYLRISLLGIPGTMVVFAGIGYLRGLQDTRTTLLVAVGTAVGNLALELVLIFGLGFGIGASALSTAEYAAAAVYVGWVLRAVAHHETALRPDRVAIAALARVSRDLFVRTAALRGSLTLATAVAARIGTVDLAAHQIAFEIWSFLALALDAIAIAAQAMIGRLLGAGDGAAARAAGRRMIEWGIVAGVVSGLGVLATRTVLPRIFTDDVEVVVLTMFLLWFVALLQPVNAVVFVLDGVLIGAGDMRFLAWAMLGAGLVFVPAAALVLVLGLGIGWLWGAIALLMGTRLVALSARFAGDHWIVTGAPTSG